MVKGWGETLSMQFQIQWNSKNSYLNWYSLGKTIIYSLIENPQELYLKRYGMKILKTIISYDYIFD